MGAAYLTYTLLMITSFHSGHREMVPFSGYTQEECETEAAEKNTGWELYGDRDAFKSIKHVCLPGRRVP